MKVSGRLVDVQQRCIYPVIVYFENGTITEVERTIIAPDNYILPGLIDAHIHIESSMITPGAFALAAVKHGTTGVVSDPHEIANVLGIEGVDFMINDAKKVPFNFWFGAPSCVPATDFETSGGVIDHNEIEKLLLRKEIKYLAEMMNFPGVIFKNEEVWGKIEIAKKLVKPIDGHAPGLRGEMLKKYVSAGISTDHECSSIDEAKEKISLGMKVLIREGSAARNLDALKELIKTDPEMVMLCSDDLHPEMLLLRHINKLVAKLIADGFDLFDVVCRIPLEPSKVHIIFTDDKCDRYFFDIVLFLNVGKRVYVCFVEHLQFHGEFFYRITTLGVYTDKLRPVTGLPGYTNKFRYLLTAGLAVY